MNTPSRPAPSPSPIRSVPAWFLAVAVALSGAAGWLGGQAGHSDSSGDSEALHAIERKLAAIAAQRSRPATWRRLVAPGASEPSADSSWRDEVAAVVRAELRAHQRAAGAAADAEADELEPLSPEAQVALEEGSALLERALDGALWEEDDRTELHDILGRMRAADQAALLAELSAGINRGDIRTELLPPF